MRLGLERRLAVEEWSRSRCKRARSEKDNRKILKFPESHIARRFLDAFIGCRCDCIGIEASDDPIDQTWFSAIEAKEMVVCCIRIKFLAFDIATRWMAIGRARTDGKRTVFPSQLPRMRELLSECENAAAAEENRPLMPMIAKVRRMLDLWEQCILERTKRGASERNGTKGRLEGDRLLVLYQF